MVALTDIMQKREPYSEMLDLLEWMNRKGGLGFDVHDRIIETVAFAKKHQNDERQKFINVMFSIALMSVEHMVGKTRNEITDWVAYNLRELGYYTLPVGASWGVLMSKEEYESRKEFIERRQADDAIVRASVQQTPQEELTVDFPKELSFYEYVMGALAVLAGPLKPFEPDDRRTRFGRLLEAIINKDIKEFENVLKDPTDDV